MASGKYVTESDFMELLGVLYLVKDSPKGLSRTLVRKRYMPVARSNATMLRMCRALARAGVITAESVEKMRMVWNPDCKLSFKDLERAAGNIMHEYTNVAREEKAAYAKKQCAPEPVAEEQAEPPFGHDNILLVEDRVRRIENKVANIRRATDEAIAALRGENRRLLGDNERISRGHNNMIIVVKRLCADLGIGSDEIKNIIQENRDDN